MISGITVASLLTDFKTGIKILDNPLYARSMKIQKLAFVVLIIAAGCSSKVTTTGSNNTTPSGKYTEDLSTWRPKDVVVTDTVKNKNTTTQTGNPNQPRPYVEAKFSVNETVDTVLDSINRINLANGLIDGFTIQIYSGVKREEALNVKKDLSVTLPNIDSEVQYVQPNFRVRAGKYYDRLQAQKDYLIIRKHFPNAIVIPDRIPIN
jgi:hypothetical protein